MAEKTTATASTAVLNRVRIPAPLWLVRYRGEDNHQDRRGPGSRKKSGGWRGARRARPKPRQYSEREKRKSRNLCELAAAALTPLPTDLYHPTSPPFLAS